MTKDKKHEIYGELVAKFADSPNFYIMDASGMTVAQTNAFRRMCFEKGIEYKVVKNSLIKKALQTLKGDYSSFDKTVLKGFSGIMFSPTSGNLPAKLVMEFHKKNEKLKKPLLKGASIDSDIFIGNDQLETLSTLKGKNELIGDIIGLLQSPAKNVVSALQSGGGKIAGVLKTLSERPE